MKYFKIKDREISRLGYGCMRFPIVDGDNGRIDKEKAELLLIHAIEQGVNYIDTAYPYHEKTSESFVGEVLKAHNIRDKVNLATKLPCWLVKEPEDFQKILDQQLKNLKTDYIDFYLLHSLALKTYRKMEDLGVLKFLDEIKEKGIVKHVGFSFHDEYVAFVEILESYNWDFCQIQLNYIDTDYQAGLKGYKLAEEKQIPVVIMEPLKGGRLSNPPEEVVELKNQVAKDSPSMLALKYPLSLKNVMTVLSGMNTKDQIDENIETASTVEPGKLTAEEKNFYQKAKAVYKKRERIGCTRCEYCMPCTVKINIPKVFSLWNKAYLYDEETESKKAYQAYLKDGITPEKCIECKKCERECPQNLKIVEGLKQAHKYLK